jgi:hypothetical protein
MRLAHLSALRSGDIRRTYSRMALFSLSLFRSRPERTITMIAARTITHTTPTSMMRYYNPNFCDPGRVHLRMVKKFTAALWSASIPFSRQFYVP